MEKINIAQLLKDCPQGMELDCTMVDDVTFYGMGNEETIVVKRELVNQKLYLDRYGAPFVFPKEDLKCVIFPKGKTTWEGFVPPCEFKDGDIITSKFNDICIFKGENVCKGTVDYYCGISPQIENKQCFDFLIKNIEKIPNSHFGFITEYRFSTEEEKQKLFDAIKANGYKWNEETKTLEKLIEPKFKVGDKVKRKDVNYTYIITIAKFGGDYYDYVNEDGQCGVIHISKQDDWELVPNKFDINTLIPFESKVLVRDYDDDKWHPGIWGFYDKGATSYPYKLIGDIVRYCIPYEGNEHLLGKTDDCSEFYKNW